MNRRLRKQPIALFNPWNFAAEPGDRMYLPVPESEGAHIYDVYESRGRNKRAAGELSRRIVKRNGIPRLAFLDDTGVWRWCDVRS
jgi:hypothetical protein